MIRVSSFGILKSPHQKQWRDLYIKRLRDQIPFEWVEIPLKKNPDERPKPLLLEESKFLKENASGSFYLLDAGGKEMNSREFYDFCFIKKRGDLHLVIGPAVGFHSDFAERAAGKISLSKLTFTHALAQTMLAETLYRSMCILQGHPFVK